MKDKPSSEKREKALNKPARRPAKAETPSRIFPIVGIGASAGGLEALQQFFLHMPSNSRMAFVVIQHMDPAQKGTLPEILQRFTAMKCSQIEDGMRAEPDRIYVIPPNKNLSVLNGTFHLLNLPARSPRFSIDFFFHQLAEDRRERSIGIILSGMGSDGSQGIRVIKEKLGMIMAQEPLSASYDSMPRSAIETGLVDYIAPPQDLPGKLIDYVRHAYRAPREKPAAGIKWLNALQKIFILIRGKAGQDFSLYKQGPIQRRIERRMGLNQIESIAEYVAYLERNPNEIDLLFRELLINVTGFFRDPEAFAVLEQKYIPELVRAKPRGSILRVWVPGCSSGEEAYTLAMILRDCIQKLESDISIQIFASDIDKAMIERARQGIYPANIAQNVPPEYLNMYFRAQEGGRFRVAPEIRETVVFAVQNVIKDPPFIKVDLLSCRNLLIYFSADLQKKMASLFHYALNPSGILFLGSAETIGGPAALFTPLDIKWKVYRRLPGKTAIAEAFDIGAPLFPAHIGREEGVEADVQEKPPSVSEIACKYLLDHYAPPGLFINMQGDILFVSGRTGMFLEPAPGRASMNVFAMAKGKLATEIRLAVQNTILQSAETVVTGLNLEIDGRLREIGFTVKPVRMPPEDVILLIAFDDLGRPAKKAEPPRRKKTPEAEPGLEEELRITKDRLQAALEGMQASQEELRAANEELQSTNEEMQSTNEELNSSKEEMQTLNAELVSVNSELERKISELQETNNDLGNLMNSLETAIVFLTDDLKIRKFTPQMKKVVHIIEGDIGRPLKDLVTRLKRRNIAEDAKEVLSTLSVREVQVESNDGKWYDMRIIPYRDTRGTVAGVLLAFSEITTLKRLEASLSEAKRYSESIVETVREPLIILSDDLTIVSANRSFYETFRVSREETENKKIYDLGDRQWDIPELRRLLEEIIPEKLSFEDFTVDRDFPRIGIKKMVLNARMLRQEESPRALILLAMNVEK